ncbi:MAG: hypothetical protein OIF54_12635 [Cohaesibacter sp.]|nr:hypothetical protein [Cohaesibacter sp.]
MKKATRDLLKMSEKDNSPLPIGIGILSWKGYASLHASLKSYDEQKFLDLFAEKHLFLPEAEQQGRIIAQENGLTHSEHPDNLGILGGFEALASNMTSDYVLLLENDLPLITDQKTAYQELKNGLALLKQEKAQVIRMRSRRYPGEAFTTKEKYKRYYATPNASSFDHSMQALRRLIRPNKANRLIGTAPYLHHKPENHHPEIIRDCETDFLLIDAKHIHWTNQSILINRHFFLEQIIGYAKTAKTKRTANGFKNLEIEMRSPHWHKSGWKVGLGQGILTHARKGDRGYD